MNRIVFLVLFFSLSACNYFENKKVNAEDLLEEQLQTFNWNAVDKYPTFTSCDSILEKEAAKYCFQNIVITNVTTFLNEQHLVVNEDINDTITLNLEIDKAGKLIVKTIVIKPETTAQIPKIDSLLRQSLKTIPKLFPATKRGQQVTTAFQLPVIIRINE